MLQPAFGYQDNKFTRQDPLRIKTNCRCLCASAKPMTVFLLDRLLNTTLLVMYLGLLRLTPHTLCSVYHYVKRFVVLCVVRVYDVFVNKTHSEEV